MIDNRIERGLFSFLLPQACTLLIGRLRNELWKLTGDISFKSLLGFIPLMWTDTNIHQKHTPALPTPIIPFTMDCVARTINDTLYLNDPNQPLSRIVQILSDRYADNTMNTPELFAAKQAGILLGRTSIEALQAIQSMDVSLPIDDVRIAFFTVTYDQKMNWDALVAYKKIFEIHLV